MNAYILDGPHRGKILEVNPKNLHPTLKFENSEEDREPFILYKAEGAIIGGDNFPEITKSYTEYKLIPRTCKYYVECQQRDYYEWDWEEILTESVTKFENFSPKGLRDFCSWRRKKFFRYYPLCYSTDGKWHQGAVKKFLQLYTLKKLVGEGAELRGIKLTKESLIGKSIDEILHPFQKFYKNNS